MLRFFIILFCILIILSAIGLLLYRFLKNGKKGCCGSCAGCNLQNQCYNNFNAGKLNHTACEHCVQQCDARERENENVQR